MVHGIDYFVDVALHYLHYRLFETGGHSGVNRMPYRFRDGRILRDGRAYVFNGLGHGHLLRHACAGVVIRHQKQIVSAYVLYLFEVRQFLGFFSHLFRLSSRALCGWRFQALYPRRTRSQGSNSCPLRLDR